MFDALARVLRPLALCSALAFIAAGWNVLQSSAAASAATVTAPARDTASPGIMYAAHGHLWLRPVDGSTAQLIHTPWALPTDPNSPEDIQWSPDGSRVALDDGKSRLAVINLSTGHVTILLRGTCTSNCSAPTFAWSPNSRYLAIVRPTGSNGELAILMLWDSAHGTMRSLLAGVSGFSSSIDWSHTSTRMLISTGTFDTIKSIFPSATIVTLGGRTHTLGKGIGYGFSSDDRFIAAIRLHECGANTCDEAEIVQPSAGGSATILAQHMSSTFDNPGWAPIPGGYAFDRWVLDSSGRIARRLAGPKERIDSWERDGSHVALESYHPYEETPDALYISTPQGKRVHLYTAGRKDSCGACSKDVYRVTWGHGGTLLAFVTPEYPTPKTLVTVHPKFFLTGINGGPLTSIPVPGTDNVEIIGFVDNDQELIIRSAGKIYRYVIATKSLTVIATGVTTLASPALDPAQVTTP